MTRETSGKNCLGFLELSGLTMQTRTETANSDLSCYISYREQKAFGAGS